VSKQLQKKELTNPITEESCKLLVEARTLALGDYMFVVRGAGHKTPEFVVDFIMERKTARDFNDPDTRIEEQKYRLQKCGLLVVYLIEESLTHEAEVQRVSLMRLEEQLNDIQIYDGFHLKRTLTLDATIDYLSCIAQFFYNKLARQTLIPKGLTLEQFNSLNSKTNKLTVKGLFTRQLLQIQGCSLLDAEAIIQVYPTPLSLIKAFENCPLENRPQMLSSLYVGSIFTTLHPTLSKSIYEWCCST